MGVGCAQVRQEMGMLGLVRAPEIDLAEKTDDPEYGYTPEHPIKVGGFLETTSHRNQYVFLRQLAGPNGEALTFQRVGSCCPFRVSGGQGLLDIWEVSVEGGDVIARLYLDSYRQENPKIPVGLTRRRD